MRILAIAALALLVPVLNAQQRVQPNVTNDTQAATYNFAPIAVVGPTEVINLTNSITKNHTFEFYSVGAYAGTCTFRGEGSADGLNWFDITSTQQCTAPLQFSVDQRPQRFIRINVLSYNGTAPLRFFYTGTR